MPYVSRICIENIWNSISEIKVSPVRATVAAAASLLTIAYLFPKTRAYFHWPVSVLSSAGCAIFSRLFSSSVEENKPTKIEGPSVQGDLSNHSESTKLKEHEADGEPEEEKGVPDKGEDSRNELAAKTLEDGELSEKREGKQEEALSSKKDDGLLNDLSSDILNLLREQGYSDERIILAVECCKKFSNLELSREIFFDEVKRSLSAAKEIEDLLQQKGLACSLEGIFVITCLPRKSQQDCLLDGTELPNTFDKNLEEIVISWNLIEPLRKEGYSFEEVSSGLFFHSLVTDILQNKGNFHSTYQKIKEFIDLARQAAKLMNEHGYQAFSFQDIFFAIYEMKEDGSFLDLRLSLPDMFCKFIAMTIQVMIFERNTFAALLKKGYTSEEIKLAKSSISEAFFMKAFMPSAQLTLSSSFTLDASEVENAINTARKFSNLFQKHKKGKIYSFEEILLASNTLRRERAQSLDKLLKGNVKTLCNEVEKKILNARAHESMIGSASNSLSSFPGMSSLGSRSGVPH